MIHQDRLLQLGQLKMKGHWQQEHQGSEQAALRDRTAVRAEAQRKKGKETFGEAGGEEIESRKLCFPYGWKEKNNTAF